jgi:hypothetical protein
MTALESICNNAGYATKHKRVLTSAGKQHADLEILNMQVAQQINLLVDVTLRHDFVGAGPNGLNRRYWTGTGIGIRDLALGLAEVARSCRSSRRIRRSVVHRCHALHITVVLSKAAHSGPSVCLRARAPCPLRVSRPGADRAERAAQAAGVSVQCKLQVLALPCPLGSKH